MKLSIRFLLIPLFLILFSLFFIPKVFAQTPSSWIPDSPKGTSHFMAAQVGNDNLKVQNDSAKQNLSPNTNPDVPKNLHMYTQNVMIEIMSAMTCQLAGIDPVNPNQKCLGTDPKTGKIGFVERGGGAIGVMQNMIAATFTPPLHTGDYFNYLAKNFGISKHAYAAVDSGTGSGFQGILPLVKIWSAFRNIVYLIFTVALIIIGLLIMLRIKIDPRTVMSIENQIPKIIIGLLLVTFSFAIAGFLIDIMYVIIFLIFNIFMDPQIGLNSKAAGDIINTQQTFNGDNVLGVFNNLVGFGKIVINSSLSVERIVISLFSLQKISNGNVFIWSGMLDAAGTLQNTFSLLLSGIVALLALLIISIAILFSLIRLWFQLILAYVYILIAVMLGPFFIIAGVLPGIHGFGVWLRFLISNLSAFPTTIIMFLLGKVLMESFNNAPSTIFVPPLIGNPSGGSASPIGALIGLGIILMTPQVVAMMKELFKSPDFKYTAAIGKAVGVGVGAANIPSHAGKLGQLGYQREYFWRFNPILKYFAGKGTNPPAAHS